MSREIGWFGCGAASAVAIKMRLNAGAAMVIAYCQTGSEHPDNERFTRDCERWYGQEIIRLQSAHFADTWAVWEKRRYLSGFNGAPCTGELKVAPRLDFQLPSDIHVWGYTADKLDAARAKRMLKEYPLLTQLSPLIEARLTKANVLALIEGAGIELPEMYKLGFHNNNCIPCVKATSPAYWALIRKHFPLQFARMAKLSRELGARLAIVGREKGPDGKVKNIRAFIDEIRLDQPTKNPIQPSCDFLCPTLDVKEAA